MLGAGCEKCAAAFHGFTLHILLVVLKVRLAGWVRCGSACQVVHFEPVGLKVVGRGTFPGVVIGLPRLDEAEHRV
eukprot:632684-Amphidinium_carterae.1